MTIAASSEPDLEGFAPDACHVVALAQDEARSLGHDRLGTEHLLLGLLSATDGDVSAALDRAGARLDAARRKVTEAVGQGVSDAPVREWSPRATRALRRAPRFARDRHSAEVGAEHLLLAVLDVEGTAGQVLRGLGVDLEHLHASFDDHERSPSPVEPAAGPPRPARPACPTCRAPVSDGLHGTDVPLRGPAERYRVVVVSCPACGTILGVT